MPTTTPTSRRARFYVRRTRRSDGKLGFTGPVRGEAQAAREVAAWQDAGWDAVAEPTSPELRAEIRAWEKARDARR